MATLKKGLRLNETNRKEIVEQIIQERLGKALRAMEKRRTAMVTTVKTALFNALGKSEIDVSQIPVGVMPTIVRHYLGDGYAVQDKLLDFKCEVPVPFSLYSQGIDTWKFKFKAETLAELETFAADDCNLRSERKALFDKLMTHLGGYTSPQKLIASVPDFEQYLPEDMYDEGAEAEQQSLADILGESAPEKKAA